jgi:hypothetical protein
MQKFSKRVCGVCLAIMVFWIFASIADENKDHSLKATLDGFQQTPPIYSAASGEFTGDISSNSSSMAFTLKYADLSSTPQAIQVYFGRPAENGRIIVELCGGSSAPCPASPGVLTGTINVVTIDTFKTGEILGAIEEENNGRGHFDRVRWHGHQGGGSRDDGGNN